MYSGIGHVISTGGDASCRRSRETPVFPLPKQGGLSAEAPSRDLMPKLDLLSFPKGIWRFASGPALSISTIDAPQRRGSIPATSWVAPNDGDIMLDIICCFRPFTGNW